MDDPKDSKKDVLPCGCVGECTCSCCCVCKKPLDDKDFKEKCVCCYCADAEGNIKSYDDLITGMTGFFKSQRMGDEEASKQAKDTIDNCEAMTKGLIKKE
jgi:hypothetical protein